MTRPKASGLPREEEDRLRLAHLLDSAAEVFFELGYEATTTAAIAARARSSKRALYAHFRTKEELFLAMVDHRTAKIADRVSAIFAQGRALRETLLAVAQELLRSLLSAEHTALTRLVYTQAPQLPQAAQFMTDRGPNRGIVKLAAHLKRQAAQDLLAIPDAQLAARQFAGLLVGDLVHRSMLGQDVPRSDQEIKAHVESAVDAFLKIYRRPEAS